MRRYLLILVLLGMASSSAPAAAPAAVPFRLPVGAKLSPADKKAQGWQGQGEVAAPFVQARARLLSAVTAADWRLVHEIPLNERNGGMLMAFARGNQELTLMVWRQKVDRSGFSFGVSRGQKK